MSSESAPKTEHAPLSERALRFRERLQKIWQAQPVRAESLLITEASFLFDEMERESGSVGDLVEAAKWAVMEWRLHGQLTDSCRHLEAALAKAGKR